MSRDAPDLVSSSSSFPSFLSNSFSFSTFMTSFIAIPPGNHGQPTVPRQHIRRSWLFFSSFLEGDPGYLILFWLLM